MLSKNTSTQSVDSALATMIFHTYSRLPLLFSLKLAANILNKKQFSCAASLQLQAPPITTGWRHPITSCPQPAGPPMAGPNYSEGCGICITAPVLRCTHRLSFLRAGARQRRRMMRHTMGQSRARIPHGIMGIYTRRPP
jgi:hypothetical protein